MIHHFSIAVHEPERVAQAVAEIAGGRVVPFPPHANSFMMLTGGAFDPAIEFYPIDVELMFNEATKSVTFGRNPSPSRYTATHAAITVPATQEQIFAVARREGWASHRARRGPIELVEFWIENRVMLEFFPSDIENKLDLAVPSDGRPVR